MARRQKLIVYVLKANGHREKFNEEKIIRTCLKAEVSRKIALEIVKKIKSAAKDGIRTKDIFRMILDELDRIQHSSLFFFRLRDAIAKLDSVSYELYIKEILESHGYECQWNKIIKGKSVEHQVDVIAKRTKLFLVECKKHVNPHRFCGLGIILQVEARLEDIKDGFNEGKNNYDFDQAWIFNNTRFSEHAIKYAEAKGILLSGWGYKGKLAIEKMADKNKVYPVTILKTEPSVYQRLLHQRIITIQDVMKEKIKIQSRIADDLRNQVSAILV